MHHICRTRFSNGWNVIFFVPVVSDRVGHQQGYVFRPVREHALDPYLQKAGVESLRKERGALNFLLIA